GTSLKQSISEETLYVGQQTIVTLSLLSDQQLVDASFSDLRYDGVWKEDLGKERSFRRMIDRREFIVHQLRHALFPLRPGEVTIPRRVMTVTQLEPTGRPMGRFGLDLFDPNFFGFNRKRSVKLQSKPVTLQVKKLPPVPANLSNLSSQHVLVGDTSLSLGYNSEPLKVGDSVTVTYELKTEGNANPLEELPIHFPKTVKVYPETPQLEKKVVGNRLEFHKQFRYSIVPLNGGDIEIPEVQLLYFVPEIGEYRTANARPVKLSVVGLPSDTVVGASTVISAPQIQPTEPSYAPYEELTFAQRMNRQLSLPLAVVVSAMLALLAVLSFLAYEVFRRRSLGFANLREVDNASTLGDLKGVFLRQLSKRLSASANLKTRQELQFALEKNQVEPGLSHQIVTLFDDFEFSQYGKEDTLFHEVRERTKALLSKFR
ncbi:MAG: BatD family protein, partial [Bdellovibrionales bacterium]|nr:BatD family protein [Bdellovibrionales bacterium]